MRKGLLAEWRRGIVARGLAAAALLAVPVGVAAAIGFGTSVAGLTEGLDSLANGPDSSQAAPAGSAEIDSVIAAIAAGEAAGASPRDPGNAGTPGAGGGTGAPGGEGGSRTETEQPPGGAGGGSPGLDPPDVDVPNSNPVGDLVQDLNDSLGGLLGGGN